MRAAPMPGATRLYTVPARAEQKRGRPESRDSRLKLRPQEPLIMAGQDLDFSWYQWQVDALKEDYNAGIPLMEIAERLNRDYREVAFMIMELAHFGKLEPRKSGIMGDKPGK